MRVTGRWLYFIFASLFLLGVFAQFFLAGMAIFGGSQYWADHTFLVHLFGVNLPILMMISAFMGKAKKNDYLFILGSLVLIVSMYVTANLGFNHAYLGAFHPIAGILLVVLSGLIIYRSIRLIKQSIS